VQDTSEDVVLAFTTSLNVCCVIDHTENVFFFPLGICLDVADRADNNRSIPRQLSNHPGEVVVARQAYVCRDVLLANVESWIRQCMHGTYF